MSGRDLEADDFPHGTVDGWERGCKGRWCPSETVTCLSARTRFLDDWGYRKHVLAERARRDAIKAAAAGRRRRFSDEDEQILRSMAAEGKNNADIAKVIGFTSGAIGFRRRELGLPSVRRGRPSKKGAEA